MKGKFLAVLAALSVAGCASMAPPPPQTISVAFDPAAYTWARAHGRNTITGDAVLRTRGGEVKTCAGLDVRLIPAGPYTDEYIQRRFGASGGFESLGAVWLQPTQFVLDPQLEEFTTSKVCNAQGQFVFDGLPDGDYYVIVKVIWEAPTGGTYSYMQTQGGNIAKRVSVHGGQSVSVTLTA